MMTVNPNKKKINKVLIIVENLPVPFDRRTWQEAKTLSENGYQVSVICPKGRGFDKTFEVIDDIHIFRHPLPKEADGPLGYLVEYSAAMFFEFFLAFKVLFKRGFDVIHACNPPDLIFIVAGFFKLFFRKKFVFDHHDINPELYLAKFESKDFFYKLLLFFEYCSFKVADVCIATNNSYREIAITRGKKNPDQVFVVRSGPNLDRLKIVKPVKSLKYGKKYLVGYVGVMGKQEGIDLLLRAVEYIVNQLKRTDVHFTLIGSGTSLYDMKALANSLAIDNFVNFTGQISDDDLLKILNTADVCVNPDVANEMNDKSTMNKIMEYMALSKPIVQFDLTEGKYSAAEASLYAMKNDFIDMAIKILYLLDNKKLRMKMGECGRSRIEINFEWKHEIPKLLKAYNKLSAPS